MPFCYILFSETINRFYIGYTNDSIENRIYKHNHGSYGKKSFTAQTSDWEIFLLIECKCEDQAIKIEHHIKNMKSRKYIENLKKYKDMIDKLLDKYKCE